MIRGRKTFFLTGFFTYFYGRQNKLMLSFGSASLGVPKIVEMFGRSHIKYQPGISRVAFLGPSKETKLERADF